MFLKISRIMRVLILLPALMLVNGVALAQSLNLSESINGKPALVYQKGGVVSEIGGKQNTCPKLGQVQRMGSNSQSPCYVLHKIKLLGQDLVIKTTVWWNVDQWGEGFRLEYSTLRERDEAPYFSKSVGQVILEFEDFGEKATNYYQLLVSKQGENLVVEQAALVSGGSQYFSYKIGDPDFTSISVTPICRKKNLNHAINREAQFDLGQFIADSDLKDNCVFCLISYDESEYRYFKTKLLDYLNCQLGNGGSKKLMPLPKEECLEFCETIEDNKWPAR